MRQLYNIIFYLILPIVFLRLFIKSLRSPLYKKRWLERLALCSYRSESSIWIHAVSLGEAVATTPLIKALKKKYPKIDILVTTMTPTGSSHIVKTFGDRVIHTYIPYDYSGALKRFLRYMNPKILIIMETELWPNLLHFCAKKGVPVLLANARLSSKSEKQYKKIKWFMTKILRNINVIATQSQIDTERFINIGASSVKTIGNIKYDMSLPDNLSIMSENLSRKLNGKVVWVAASTHDDEEKQVLEAFKIVKQVFDVLLILIPRHPERFAEISLLCKKSFKTISYKKDVRNSHKSIPLNTEIIVGDTMGDLLLFYSLADVAFIGGSLVPIGGHNLLEAALVGTPIITGTHLDNFIEISQILESKKALIKVGDYDELAGSVIKLLQNRELMREQAQRAKEVLEDNRGVLKKLLGIVDGLLSGD